MPKNAPQTIVNAHTELHTGIAVLHHMCYNHVETTVHFPALLQNSSEKSMKTVGKMHTNAQIYYSCNKMLNSGLYLIRIIIMYGHLYVDYAVTPKNIHHLPALYIIFVYALILKLLGIVSRVNWVLRKFGQKPRLC